jgi:CBS domain-containing protein
MYHKNILVLEQATPSCEAARSMNERNCGYAIVSNGKGRMVGIVTDRDLACGILGERLNAHSPISEVMSGELKYVDENESVLSALKLMQEFGVRRVPVIHESAGGSQKCVGVYTFDEIILEEQSELAALKKILRRQFPKRTRRMATDTELSEIHRDEQLNRFNRIIADEIQMKGDLAEKVIYHLIRSIVQRVPKEKSKRFILDLPALIHEDFLNLKVNSERHFSLYAIELELTRRYGLKKDAFHQLLPKFWRGLSYFVSKRNLMAVYKSLPKDLQKALIQVEDSNFSKILDNVRNLERVHA